MPESASAGVAASQLNDGNSARDLHVPLLGGPCDAIGVVVAHACSPLDSPGMPSPSPWRTRPLKRTPAGFRRNSSSAANSLSSFHNSIIDTTCKTWERHWLRT